MIKIVQSGSSIVQSLYRDSWINQQTRAVFVEFTLYNPNVNLFTGVQLLAEFPPVGAAVTFTSIITFRLYHYVGALGSWIVISQVRSSTHRFFSTSTFLILCPGHLRPPHDLSHVCNNEELVSRTTRLLPKLLERLRIIRVDPGLGGFIAVHCSGDSHQHHLV